MPISRRRYGSGPLGSTMATATASPGGHRGPANQPVRCGVCTRELTREGLHLQTAQQMLGSFCSSACLGAVEALMALHRWAEDLDRRGKVNEAEAREALADELLLLWRRHAGPDPRLVAEAVGLAQARGRSSAAV